ncbi:MAG TPA: DUF1488 domain-containing protein [Bradyrhizobium sp.]|jgi:hypothetical protein|nr:DUF1488 domain-containing protein [Bradyrhizobium sp.]
MMWPWRQPANATNGRVAFPNQSRSYDPTLRAVRFWGYDRSMENSFLVTSDALRRMEPDLQADEASVLRVFDRNRELIFRTAAKVYARGRRRAYNLVAADF